MSINRLIMVVALLGCSEAKRDGDLQQERVLPGVAQEAGSPGTDSVLSTSSTREKVTVLFFGTSLTAGYGLDPSVAFPRLVAEKAAASGVPMEAVNAGLSGETSAGAVRRIDWTLKLPVDVVVIETGGNDALRALNADSLQKNLRSIVRSVRRAQPAAKIVLAVMEAPPNLGAAYTERFRDAYARVSREEGLILMPFLLEGVAGHDELNQPDGVHPNERGERIVADNVWKALKPVVEEVYRGRKTG